MRFPFLRRASGASFIHPLDPAPKTIVLAPGFQATRSIRVFPDGWSEAAARVGPCSVAAPVHELLRLAEAGVELQHAAIVLTSGAHSDLSEHDRNKLWEAFGVPVFEQCIGPNNKLLAAECEAHDGLHVVGGTSGRHVEAGVCGCGSSVPRLMPKRQERPAHVRELQIA